MISCAICKFEVSNKMRHALLKNMCPACGHALLGDFHMQRLNMIKQKISAQEFSGSIDQSIIFELSLFIMSEFFPSNPNRAVTSEDAVSESDDSTSDLEKIRDQVRRDALASAKIKPAKVININSAFEDMDDSADADYDSEDDNPYDESDIPTPKTEQDLKVAKLKRIYNDSPNLNKSGISVRRVN